VVLAGPAPGLVHGLKYDGWAGLAAPMGDRMANTDLPVTAPVVVPVPTTAARVRRRGYNQAALLAWRVARRRGWTFEELLERRSGGVSQTTLRPEQRAANVRGAFRCSDPSRIRGREVLLVDDVLTTGATAGEAAGELAAAGAVRVTLLVFARALPDAA
jgi:ComF family protein